MPDSTHELLIHTDLNVIQGGRCHHLTGTYIVYSTQMGRRDVEAVFLLEEAALAFIEDADGLTIEFMGFEDLASNMV